MKKIIIYKSTLLLALIVSISSCEVFELDKVNNPNAADAAVVESDATKAQIQGLVTGLESRHRGYLATTSRAFGSFGRETLSFRDSDPRFTQDWLGRALPPDAAFFAVGNTYNAPYQAIKQANFLIEAANNTANLTAAEIAGIEGFAKTIQGYQYLVPWLAQGSNGIRIDVSDPLNPGPRLDQAAALTAIRSILDEGNTALGNAGSSFTFSLTSGFAGFDSPATMRELNRAIAARAAMYASDWAGVISALNGSFMDPVGSQTATTFAEGPAHSYAGPPDGFNPMFFPLDQFSTQLEVVHPVVIRDMLAGDARASKFFERVNNPVTNQALVEYTATHQDGRWASNTTGIPFIRQEELVLMLAEAEAQTGGTTAAVAAIDAIRTVNGLAVYAGGTTAAELIDEILFQRRYSLWFEPMPHRWADLRRYDRLDELEGDWQSTTGAFIATDESIFTQLAIPQAEINWDNLQSGN